MNIEEELRQFLGEMRGENEQLIVRDFDPNKADLFKRLKLKQNGNTISIVQAAMMKSGIVVTSFQEVGRCRCCRQYDAKSVMTLCAGCRMLACMDCMQELDGRLLCGRCHEEEAMKKRLKACGAALSKSLSWLWKLKVQF